MTYLMILQTNHAKLESKRQWVHRIIHHCCVIPCGVCVYVCVSLPMFAIHMYMVKSMLKYCIHGKPTTPLRKLSHDM